MEKTKKKAQDTVLTAFIAVTATMAFIGGFVLSGSLKDRIFRASEKDDTVTDLGLGTAGMGGSSGKTLGFDERYVVAEDDNNYDIILGTYSGMNNSYVDIQYGETRSQLVFAEHTYGNNEVKRYVINFPGRVVDVHMSTFDLDVNLNTVFVLLEDGQVEYILIEDALNNNNIRTYGTVGIENVAKFYEGTSCEIDSDYCVKTAFAQTTSGKIYNLYDYIK